MESFPIFEMPEEIQALVVDCVAVNSITDFYNLRRTCKSMKVLTERRRVYQLFDVLSFPWGLHIPHSLLTTCYAEGNPSTMYIKGVQLFYSWNLQEEGLALIKCAADAGYECAVYVYAMTRKIFWNDEDYFARFTRESAAKVGNLVRSVKWGFYWEHIEQFLIKKHLFIINVVPTFYACPCVPFKDVDWDLWFIENNKDDNMCDRCFWIKEVSLFFRDFEPICTHRDTRTW